MTNISETIKTISISYSVVVDGENILNETITSEIPSNEPTTQKSKLAGTVADRILGAIV